eukprot:3300458-Rhodomonas_salina.1
MKASPMVPVLDMALMREKRPSPRQIALSRRGAQGLVKDSENSKLETRNLTQGCCGGETDNNVVCFVIVTLFSFRVPRGDCSAFILFSSLEPLPAISVSVWQVLVDLTRARVINQAQAALRRADPSLIIFISGQLSTQATCQTDTETEGKGFGRRKQYVRE